MPIQHSCRHARQLDTLLLQTLGTVVRPPTFLATLAPVDEPTLDPAFVLTISVSVSGSQFKSLAKVHDLVPDLAPSSSALPPTHSPVVLFDQGAHVERREGIAVLRDLVDDTELLCCAQGLNIDFLSACLIDFVVVGEELRGSLAEGLSARCEG